MEHLYRLKLHNIHRYNLKLYKSQLKCVLCNISNLCRSRVCFFMTQLHSQRFKDIYFNKEMPTAHGTACTFKPNLNCASKNVWHEVHLGSCGAYYLSGNVTSAWEKLFSWLLLLLRDNSCDVQRSLKLKTSTSEQFLSVLRSESSSNGTHITVFPPFESTG